MYIADDWKVNTRKSLQALQILTLFSLNSKQIINNYVYKHIQK